MATALITAWETLKDGQIRVVWEDGHSNTFMDLEHVTSILRKMSVLDPEALALSHALAKFAGGGDARDVEGKRVTLDWADAQPVKVEDAVSEEKP